jgi:hypothetical protein
VIERRSVYRDYVLSCSPRPLVDGRFEACVVIIAGRPLKAPSQQFLDLGVFESEQAAVDRAQRAGQEWVDKEMRSA